VLQLAIKCVPHSSFKNWEITYHCCCCVLLHSLCKSLRAQNSREQASETSSSCDNCMGRRAIKFLGSATLRDYSLVRTTTFWWSKLPFNYFLLVCASGPLLLEGCSWGRHCFHSSCIKLDRLLPTAQHVDCWEWHHRPTALVLPLGIAWCSLIYLSCSFCSYTD
jgi:hypothetical protein